MKTTFYTTSSNEKIAYWHKYIDNSKIGIIIIHGLAEHKGRYKEFVNSLLSEGISVFALDLRGHGESSGSRGDIQNFSEYLDDCYEFIQYIGTMYSNLKLVVFGHSLGGLISVGCAIRNIDIDGLILSSPLLIQPIKTKLLSFVSIRLFGNIKIKKRFSESAEMLKYSKNDPLSCKYFTLRLLKAVFTYGIKYVNKNIHKVSVPVFVMGGHFDNLIKSNKFGITLKKFNSTDKVLKIYENARHRIVQNADADKAVNDIFIWLNKFKD